MSVRARHVRSAVAGLLLTVLAAPVSIAAPIGPVRPAAWRWRAGYEMGLAWDRDFASSANGADRFEFDKRFSYLGRIAFGLAENWEVSARVGAATLRIIDVGDPVSDAAGNSRNSFDLRTEIAWGAGAKGILWHDALPGWDVALDAQYLAHGRHDGVVTHGPRTGRVATRVEAGEWTTALLLQTRYRTLTPYLGPTFGDAWIRGGGLDLDADDHVGFVVGTGADFEGWQVYAEGRFLDETAVNMGLIWTF